MREGIKKTSHMPTRGSKIIILLVRPKHPENIGLVARNMKNTGFTKLRLVSGGDLSQRTYKTAVHAEEILKEAQNFDSLKAATDDLDIVFAATAKQRKNFPSLALDVAVEKITRFPKAAKIGLLFGNERTGLTSEELRHSNFRFTIPQAVDQPSYNISSAVLLTLYHIYVRWTKPRAEREQDKPIPRRKQEDYTRIILANLERIGFIHQTNKQHMTERIYDIIGRLCLTEKDSRLLLAMLSKGVKGEEG